MATTLLPSVEAPGCYGDALTVLPMTVCDFVNGNHFVCTGKDLVICWNSTAGADTVTITSVANKWGRTGTLTAVAIAASSFAIFGPMNVAGWSNGGIIEITAGSVDVFFAIVNL